MSFYHYFDAIYGTPMDHVLEAELAVSRLRRSRVEEELEVQSRLRRSRMEVELKASRLAT